MRYILSLEELGQFALAVFGLYYQPVQPAWWLWIILFFSPDISMLGYLVNTRTGACCYNLFHHKAIAIMLAAAGYFLANHGLLLTGILLFGHSSFDRVMGYGLKYEDDFKHTHLGWLQGKK